MQSSWPITSLPLRFIIKTSFEVPAVDCCRSGKELLAAKKKEDELALKRNLEARRIEKEEEARARNKIRLKLGACVPRAQHEFGRGVASHFAQH